MKLYSIIMFCGRYLGFWTSGCTEQRQSSLGIFTPKMWVNMLEFISYSIHKLR